MKVGLVSTWNAKCGIATYTSYLGKALQQLGLNVTILAERKDVLPNGYDPNFDSPLKYIECWSRYESYDKLVETVKKGKFDVIHIQHQFGLFPYQQTLKQLLVDLKGLGSRVVVTLHDVIGFNPQMADYFGCIVEYADSIIVHTDLCKQLMVRVWKCPTEKLKLIPHGTKLISVPTVEEARKQLNLPLDKKIILSWGFIWESKGLLELVEILAELNKTFPNVMLIHAGGMHPVISKKDYLKKIFKKALQLGVRPENFKITGFLDEQRIVQYFGACNLIVLNYMRGSASASGAAHRALASHRPIVGTDDPCIAEIPKYTVPRFDKQALLQGIIKVFENKTLQKQLVEKAEKVAEETSWENVTEQHKKVYDSFFKV